MSVFAKYQEQSFPYKFKGALVIGRLAGGVPSHPRVIEAWLRQKFADKDDLIREAVAEIMVERGVTADEAIASQLESAHLNGFRRDELGGLFIPGYHLKAALKEAASVAVNAGKLPATGPWGKTKKYLMNWFSEHIYVIEDRLGLGVTAPTDVAQHFPHTHNGNGIQYIEYCDEAKVSFTIESDWQLTEEQWALLWTTAERLGLGAMRSQGYGRFDVIEWDAIAP